MTRDLPAGKALGLISPFLCLMVLALFPYAGYGQEDPPPAPFRQVRRTDTRFVATKTSSSDFCYHESGSESVVVYDVEITRALSAEPNILDANGFLNVPTTAVDNGIVGREAWLQIQIFDTDYCVVPNANCPPSQPRREWHPIVDTVYVNGFRAGVLTSRKGRLVTRTIPLRIEWLKFGRYNLDGSPTPGLNRIEIHVGPRRLSGPEIRACGTGPVSIQIEAMAPVFFVHGIRSTGAFFETHRLQPPFVNPFRDKLIPHKVLGRTAGIGNRTIPRGATVLAAMVGQGLQEFGAKHCHLVGYSKGGLWSRAYISGLPDQGEQAVFSLTTLDTPHYGTLLADIRVLAYENSWLQHPYIVLSRAFNYEVVHDMSTAAMTEFNRTQLRPDRVFTVDGETNSVAYRAHSADANVNGNVEPSGLGIIDCPAECFDYVLPSAPDPGPRLYRLLQQNREVYVVRGIHE